MLSVIALFRQLLLRLIEVSIWCHVRTALDCMFEIAWNVC